MFDTVQNFFCEKHWEENGQTTAPYSIHLDVWTQCFLSGLTEMFLISLHHIT